MKIFYKLFLIFSILLAAGSCANKTAYSPAAVHNSGNYYSSLKIKDKVLEVEVASSSQAMITGLGGRKSMEENQGMLFEFKTPAKPDFWMKDMHFDLDLIWIANKKIIFIDNGVKAPSPECLQPGADCRLPLYSPALPVDQVLEVNAGWAQKNFVRIGDEVDLVKN